MPIKLNTASGGGIILQGANTASDKTMTVPADDGTIIYSNSSGNVGIGTSSPFSLLDIRGSSNGQNVLQLSNSAGSSDGTAENQIRVTCNGNNNWGNLDIQAYTTIFTQNNTERARIDSSGRLLVNTTASITTAGGNGAGKLQVTIATASDEAFTVQNTGGAGTRYLQYFLSATAPVGSITHNGTGTSYNTASDYRLKENVQPLTGALAKVAALKPCTYTWKTDGSAGEGFIAHELAEVCPGAVSGEKDAVDDDGNIKPQGIDTSFLVATLTAGLQEAVAMIEELKAKVAALEAK